MREFTIVREVTLPPEEAWARLTDWERHGEKVPLTTIRTTTDGFVARTGLGRLGFDDPMRIVELDPPHRCALVKTGRVVLGHAELSVEPTPAGSRVVWRESIAIRGVPRFADPLLVASGRRLFGGVIDHLLAT